MLGNIAQKKICHLCFVLGSADGGSWGDGVETWKRCSWNLSLVLLWWAKHLDFQMREKVVPCNYRCAYIEAEGHKGAVEHLMDTGTVSKTCWGNFWKRWWSVYALSQACTSHLELQALNIPWQQYDLFLSSQKGRCDRHSWISMGNDLKFQQGQFQNGITTSEKQIGFEENLNSDLWNIFPLWHKLTLISYISSVTQIDPDFRLCSHPKCL